MMPKSIFLIGALLVSAVVSNSASHSQSASRRITVLDGDTVVIDGSAFHIAGIDAPELGPWAKCWAEAALAGHARENLQRLLSDSTDRRDWQLRDVSGPDANGKRTARLVDREGYEINDDMVVYGYAASTSGRWDWCGGNAGLSQVQGGHQPPHGPNLWWPTAHMSDPRAAD
jgi:endonuclease YncB( thermonuclease family)